MSSPLKTGTAQPVRSTCSDSSTSTSSSPPSSSTVTGESPPRRTCATAAPHAPVPDDSVSPAPRSKMRARIVVASSSVQNDVLVRLRNCGERSISGPSFCRSSSSSSSSVGDADRALRVADRDVLEVAPLDDAAAVGRPARVVLRGEARAAHVDPAGGRARDGRPDLARDGLDREGVGVGPAAVAQVEDRLAGAVAGQLGLRAVRIEDAQAGDEAGLVGRLELEHAVGADAEVAVADVAHELRRHGLFDDHVVVAKGLPLLEPHALIFTAGPAPLSRRRPPRDR